MVKRKALTLPILLLHAVFLGLGFYLFIWLCHGLTRDFSAEIVENDAVWQYIIEIFSALLLFVGFRVLVGILLPRYLMREPLLRRYCKSDRLGTRCRKAVSDGYFWISFLPFVLFSILLPVSVGLSPIVTVIFQNRLPSDTIGKLTALGIVIPVFFCLFLWAYLKAVKRTLEETDLSQAALRRAKAKRKRDGVFGVLSLLGVAVVGPFVLMILVSIFNVSVALLPILLGIILFLLFFRHIRAIFIRRRFIKRLKQLAEKRHCRISEIRAPYRSLFLASEGVQFTVQIGKMTYSCRMLASVNRKRHIYFEQDGTGYYVRRYHLPLFMPMVRTTVGPRVVGVKEQGELFRTKKAFHYGFEATGKKILLICPVPQDVYRIDGEKALPLTMGDAVGDYTVYNASTFLSHIETGVLDS